MNAITIFNVTPDTVDVSGQTLARGYVETVLLPMLVANAGKDFGKMHEVIGLFDKAGLSLVAVPGQARGYFIQKREDEQARARSAAEAKANAERCRVPTQREILEKKAQRELNARAIRDRGDAIRAARGSGTGW